MPYSSDPAFLVLHALRLKGVAEDDVVAASSGLDVGDVSTHLKELAADDLVARRDGRVPGWSLTPAGRARHAQLAAAELDESGARQAVRGAYERFLAINQDLLGVCTAWQLCDVDGAQTINDHTDAGYDAAIVQRLVGIHDRVRPITIDLGAAMERFAGYGTRLREALDKVVAGDRAWFTKPVIDSYHTVWFELHEDLLATLGIERGSEGQSA